MHLQAPLPSCSRSPFSGWVAILSSGRLKCSNPKVAVTSEQSSFRMKLEDWLALLKRTTRTHSYKFRYNTPFELYVPFETHAQWMRSKEIESRTVLDPAIISYPTKLRWPHVRDWQMYFLLTRIKEAFFVSYPLLQADKQLNILKEADLAAFMQWGLIDEWRNRGVWRWSDGLKGEWESKISGSWKQWLYYIYVKNEPELRQPYKIKNVVSKLHPNAKPLKRGMRVFRCTFTLCNGTACWVDFDGEESPSVHELEQVMIEMPDTISNYKTDPPRIGE